MSGQEQLREAMAAALAVTGVAPEPQRSELGLLVEDLEEALTTIFVRTAEARPMIERCAQAAATLKAVAENGWSEEAATAFDEFERSVSKLRSTIMVRAQRAT